MILGVDHLAIAVADPDVAIAELASFLGVDAGTSGGQHPTWGTRNRLLWLGDTFIELCTVTDPQLAQGSWLGRATLRASPARPKAICWAIATDALDLDRARMNAAGASLGAPIRGERRRPDGRMVRWRLALPPEVDLARPFLIEHDTSAAEWTPEDRAARAAAAARLGELELPIELVAGLVATSRTVRLGGTTVRVGSSVGDQPTLRIGGLARGEVAAELLGCRWIVE